MSEHTPFIPPSTGTTPSPMRCFECDGEGDFFTEVGGEIHILCRQCYYRPDECPHDNIVLDLAGPITANTLPAMLGICTACQSVRELPSLTGDPSEMFKRGRDIDAYATESGGHWYVARAIPLPFEDSDEQR